MTGFSSLRVRLVATVFVAILPAGILMYALDLPWMGLVMGLLALGAAWFGGERFILRQVRSLLETARKLATGDLSSRTSLGDTRGELGELARAFDQMAASLQQRASDSQKAEATLLNRALQQTVVGALGQFALITSDFNTLLNQAVTMVGQTLEVEFCHVLELLPEGDKLVLRAGVGWKEGCVGEATEDASRESQAGYTLTSGEPVIVEDFSQETRFNPSPLLLDHGAASGISVAIITRDRSFGVLSACTGRQRTFTGEEVHFLLSVATVLAMAVERKRSEAELVKLASFAQLSPNPALELTADGNVTYFNDAALKLTLGVNETHPRSILPPNVIEIIQECLATSQSKPRFETKVQKHTLSWSFHPVGSSQIVHCYVDDITERLNLEAALRQSQKMESVGQLAAGVAHDFNNMLTIIQGHAGMLMARPNIATEMFESSQAIYFASERAASLTRQLLMFSRRNVMQTKILNLREVVGTLSKMLKRLLGETITLEFNPPNELPLIQGDSGMIEQVIMNLSVNARDAMPKGGTLVINVSPVEINETYTQIHPEARVGQFVCLRVTDSGTGMDTEIINRIFEPFFTTKEVGKGTGLGLATVYGIVKQHEGWIEVLSTIGKGSTFNVFFPATEAVGESVRAGTDPAAFVRGGTETILIVEDEPVLRDMAHVILEEAGYRIFTAGNGHEAISVWEQNMGEIDLLLTDMVMPQGMTGLELAEQLLMRTPSLRVIFTSGYTLDDISDELLASHNARFLQKPYTRTTIARTVRQSLDNHPAEEVVV